MPPVTGLLPRRAETRAQYDAERRLNVRAIRRETIVQPIAWIRDQRSKPSCVGQAFAAGVDSVLGEPPWASAVDLWRDARRRQANLEGIHDGTRAEYVIASLMKRGWSPYKAGEDRRPSEDDDNPKGSLADEMFAHDTRQVGAVHYAITRDRVAATIQALKAGYVVAGGWGLSEGFYKPKGDTVLGAENFMGQNGHEMRIAGYLEDRRAFLLQNSWGIYWTWCAIGTDVKAGCCLISEEALEAAWDIDAIEVKRP